MILLIDMGNSRVKWALFDGQAFVHTAAFAYEDDLYGSLDKHWHKLYNIEQVIIANVAGSDLADELTDWLHNNIALATIHFIKSQKTFKQLTNGYETPHLLGVDRWMAIVAANNRFADKSICIIDCGTAITVDAVNNQSQHLGGLIVPGVSLMHTSLSKRAPQCDINLNNIPQASGLLGSTTEQAIIGGSVYMAVAFIDRICLDLQNELPGEVTFVITGGNADTLKPLLNQATLHCPQLVLEGLALMAEELLANSAAKSK